MASIITITSDKFLKKFVKKEDFRNYNFILISDDITTENKYKNAYSVKALLPTPAHISAFINDGYCAKYREKYFKYLSNPRVEALLSVIVKLAVIDNSNVVLMCSKNEEEYKYIEMISEYLETIYKVKTISYKKYCSDKKKYDSKTYKKDVIKNLKKKLKAIDKVPETNVSKTEMRKRLKSMSKDELRAICKENSLKFAKDYDKKMLISIIMDEL